MAPRSTRLVLLLGLASASAPALAQEPPTEGQVENPAEASPNPPVPEAGSAPAPAPAAADAAPVFPDPAADEASLLTTESEVTTAPETTAAAGVAATKWWSELSPTVTLHGYFRTRLYYWGNFSFGKRFAPNDQLWPQPPDSYYQGGKDNAFSYGPRLCTAANTNEANSGGTGDALPCDNSAQAGGNLRLRLNPEIHLSDNLVVRTEIDMLDNVAFGTTPNGYSLETNTPEANERGGYAPLGAFDSTTNAPKSGINSVSDSVLVKRAWAEYKTPVGVLKFGRMPSDWGLGILANAGDAYDDDYQSTVDRIMYIGGLPSYDLYFAAGWDFPNEGPTSASLQLSEQQAWDVAQLDDVDQYVFALLHKVIDADEQQRRLARGNVIVNGGAYVVYRSQTLALDQAGQAATDGAWVPGLSTPETLAPAEMSPYQRRGASAWIPDLWLELLYKDFRFELEAVTIQGSVDNVMTDPGAQQKGPFNLSQYGIATEIEQQLMEDRLRLQFGFGYASGDPDLGASDTTGGLVPEVDGLQGQLGNDTISTFRFNPSYQVDLILYRQILTRVQGSYYFRPAADFDFVRDPSGQRIGGGAAIIYSRASELIQTPGHQRNLGVEADFSLYFQQSTFGRLADDPQTMGGFYALAQFGYLFPLGGLGYRTQQAEELGVAPGATDLNNAWTLQLYLGAFF